MLSANELGTSCEEKDVVTVLPRPLYDDAVADDSCADDTDPVIEDENDNEMGRQTGGGGGDEAGKMVEERASRVSEFGSMTYVVIICGGNG